MRRTAHGPLSLRRWPLALLLASLALTAYAVVLAQRTERSNESVGTRAASDYAAWAGWSYSLHLQESMRTIAREALGAVNHGDALHMGPQVPRARELPHYLPYHESCRCHRPRYGPAPETFFAFRLGDQQLDWAVNTHTEPLQGWAVDAPMPAPAPSGSFPGYPSADARQLVGHVTSLVRGNPDPERAYTYSTASLGSGRRIIAHTLMPTATGDTIVYGAQYSPDGFRSILRDVYENGMLLPEAVVAGRRNQDLLYISVVGDDGQALFVSAPDTPPSLSGARLGSRFGALEVRSGIRAADAGTLIVGGLPRSNLPFLLGLLALAGMLTIVAVTQLRRESELAGMRSNWISSVSHELRTPLAQIRLYVDTLRLGRATEPAQRAWALAHIDRETTRLHHLVENVLRFSQVGLDGDAERRPTDVAAEAQRIVEEFRPLVESRRIRVETHMSATPVVRLRPDSLRHILLNLLDNAARYGPDGQTILVEAGVEASAIELSVSDQGPGVPPAERDAIWRPFTRGRAGGLSTGSGIGLSIVRDAVTLHGGTVRLEDSGEGGARFVVRLPIDGTPA